MENLPARYMVGFSSQSQQIAEVLLQEGHGIRPGNEATGGIGMTRMGPPVVFA
jgi:hypothetical protein